MQTNIFVFSVIFTRGAQQPEDFQSAYHKQFKLEGNYYDFKESLDQVRSNREHLGNMPVYVISAGKKKHYAEENQKLWNKLQS